MNTKLRLLVTNKCFRNCPKCCNKQYDIAGLPWVGDLGKYDEISFTGGEPLLFEQQLVALASSIKMLYPKVKLYLYTAYPPKFIGVSLFDGITYTLHGDNQLEDFAYFQMYMHRMEAIFSYISMRLNYFPEEVHFDQERFGSEWRKVTYMFWKDKCPVPEGEDFKRLPVLWE